MSGIGKLISFLLLLSIAYGVNSQDLFESEIMIEQVEQTAFQLPVDFTASDVFLKQSGSDNTAKLTQEGYNVKMYVIQNSMFGRGNSVTVNQNGSNLYAGVAQSGFSNSVDLDMVGNYMMAGIGQAGYNNNVDLDLEGNLMYFGILQIGHNHNIEYASSGNEIGFGFNSTLSVVPIKITQKGMGANLIIKGK